MNTITLCENTLDPSTWVTHENIADIREFLVDHFGVWPDTARIYLDHVANNADITPYDQAGIDRLGRVQGHFYVVVYPEGIELILVIVAVVIAAVAIGLAFLFRPSPPNQTEQSPNNQLGARTNKARPNERIPDIFGQVWTTFDLIAVPYRTFVDNDEIEHCYMCIGRGQYDIAALRDDITKLDQIAGTSAEVYAPFTSPNGGTPFLTIGTPIADNIYNIKQSGSVNGQVLSPPNLNTVLGGGHIRFRSPNIIENDGSFNFTANFTAGDTVGVGGLVANDDLAVDSGGVQPSVHLNGTYSASAVSATQITLLNPSTINANWTALAAFAGGLSTYASINIIANADFEAGPFVLLNPLMTKIICNFVALQGLYLIDKDGNQHDWDVTIQVGVTQCDSSGTPIGSETPYTVTLHGVHTDRKSKGATLTITLPALYASLGGVRIRAKRTTNTDTTAGRSVSDQTQWRDCYMISPVTQTNFGNVTTIQTLTRPTPQALAIKDRKLNGLVTRKIPALVSGVFTGLVASKNAADILCAMALDPFIGNRQLSELDVTGIYAVAGSGGEIERYFAVFNQLSAPTEFCFTFDDSKVSFEESVASLATDIFCIAYRRGSVISLSFEKQTNNSVLLFNHRNKIPNSEQRTVTFGTLNDNDGITLDYVEPNDPNYPNTDTGATLYFPPDQSAVNPKKVTTIGIRNKYQASLLGWRLYKKLLFQNTLTQFEATEEAALLVIQDRILVADNTRSDSQDGDVLDQVVLLLTLSQAVTFDSRYDYTIFLQNPDAFVEAIGITAGPTDHQVILATAPTLPCVIDPEKYGRTTYMIVNNAPVRANAFLLSEKVPKDGKIFELKAVNYDDQYYSHDADFGTKAYVAGSFVEVMFQTPGPHTDVAASFVEVMAQTPAPNTDVAGSFVEVMSH